MCQTFTAIQSKLLKEVNGASTNANYNNSNIHDYFKCRRRQLLLLMAEKVVDTGKESVNHDSKDIDVTFLGTINPGPSRSE